MKKAGIFLFFCIIVSSTITIKSQTLTQYSTIDALLNGMYDGNLTLTELKQHGNFGIGTFNHLEGEMLILNNHIYRIQFDGKVIEPNLDSVKTPFSNITDFLPTYSFSVKNINFPELKQELDNRIGTKNHFYAIKISGQFNSVKSRSVPKQEKPYLPLASVISKQAIFNFNNVSGVLVGFRSPNFISGINVPGYHFHFITDDRSGGGHLLGIKILKAKVEIMEIKNFDLIIPDTKQFNKMKFKLKKHKALQKVEMDRK